MYPDFVSFDFFFSGLFNYSDADSNSCTIADSSVNCLRLRVVAKRNWLLSSQLMLRLFCLLCCIRCVRGPRDGTFKALGASSTAVLGQFMLEGILLSLIAGVVGIAIGIFGATSLANLLLPRPTQVVNRLFPQQAYP